MTSPIRRKAVFTFDEHKQFAALIVRILEETGALTDRLYGPPQANGAREWAVDRATQDVVLRLGEAAVRVRDFFEGFCPSPDHDPLWAVGRNSREELYRPKDCPDAHRIYYPARRASPGSGKRRTPPWPV